MNKNYLTNNNKKTKKIKANIYEEAGLLERMNASSNEVAKNAFSSGKLSGTIGGLSSGVGTIIQSSLANAEVDTTQADNAIEAINDYQPNTSSLNALASSYASSPTASVDHDYKDYTVSTGEGIANMGKAGLAGFTTGLQAGGIWGGIAGLVGGLGASGFSWLAGTQKAKREAERLNREGLIANISKANRASDAVEDIQENEYNSFMRNQISYGGPLHTHSGDWSNNIIFINEGGTHEENPLGGIPVGIDNQGVPNLVEEGEVIFNDYVFSDRLRPTKKQLKDNLLNTKYEGMSFARIVEDLQQTSAENPNDKISKDTLNDLMGIIINMQEQVRMKKNKTNKNKFPDGGWTDEDSFRREQEIMAPLWEAATAGITSKIDAAKKDLNVSTPVTPQDPTNTNSIWSTAGMLLPTAVNLGSTIYNAIKPVDKSNLIAEKAHRQRPMAKYERVNVNPKLELIDENAFVSPITNKGIAAINNVQNTAQTANQALANIANITYNTQVAEGDARLKASQINYDRLRAFNESLANIQRANSAISQAEFASNAPIHEGIANASVRDALMYEQLQQMKGEAVNHALNQTTQGAADLTRQAIEWEWIKDNPEWAPYFNRQKKCGGMLTKKSR